MENYKIKVNDEAESKEAQELFFELGYYWNSGFGVRHLDVNFLYAKNKQITIGYCSEHFSSNPCCELTLPQLRDLVAKSKNEQGLISGADAKLAWANGEDVQISHKHATLKKEWHDLYGTLMLSAFDSDMYEFRLKPSTITLNVEIPAPFEPKEGEEFFILAPLSVTGHTKVQGITTQVLLDEYVKLGAWRTEEEIKQVVAALRGGIKG